jgi:hypothetical protein
MPTAGAIPMPETRRPSAEAHRRIARAAATWGLLTLGSVAVLAALIVWHLVRRGRLIRQNLGPPRVVRLPEIPPRNGEGFTTEVTESTEKTGGEEQGSLDF